MANEKSLKVNMLMNTILTVSNFIFPLLTYTYVARVLLPVGVGKVGFVQSILAYFSYIASLGISAYGTRECAKVRDDKEKLSKLVQELLSINMISTSVAYIALFIAIILVPKFHEYAMLFVVMSSGILLQTIGIEWLYTSLEKFSYITTRSLIFKTIAVILTFIMIKGPEDYIAYGFITIFTTSASNILNFINSRKYISFKRFSHYNLKQHLKPIMVFFFTTIIINIYGNFDSMMLGFMKGDYEVGIYNSSVKIKGLILSVSTAITSVLIPRMSVYFGKGNKKQFNDLLIKSLRVTLILLLPLSIFIFINAKDIVQLICGPEYFEAVSTVRIFMICVIVLSFTNLFGNQILIPKGNEKRFSQSVFIGMFVNLGLNLLLIPKYKCAGAAFATLMTETFNMFYMGFGCKDEVKYMIKNIRKRNYIFAILIATILEIIVCSFTINLPLIIKLVINTITLFGSYYILQIILKEPIIISVINNLFTLFKRKFKNIK